MSDQVPPSHDARGKFAPGNKCGKGNPHLAKLRAAQEEVRAAAEPGKTLELLKALHARGLAGDVAAATAWLTRVLGKPREEPVDVVLELPDLKDAEAVAEGLRRAVAAVAAGELDVAAGTALVGMLRDIAVASHWRELAERVRDIEQSGGRLEPT